MSIFDQYENFLPGDKKHRKIKFKYAEYQYFSEKENDLNEKARTIFWPFYLVGLIVFLALVTQLVNLQITQGSWNKVLAKGNRIQSQHVSAPRGIIYDNKGKSLVLNDASYYLSIYPLNLPKNELDRNVALENISQATGIPLTEIKDQVKQKSSSQASPIVIRDNLDRDTALLLEVETKNMTAVAVEKRPTRNYTSINGLSQVIGYIGKVTEAELKSNSNYQADEWVGKDGLEKTYQSYLKGHDGINEIEVDSRGRVQRVLSNMSPEPGDSLTLTLDSGLEAEMSRILQSELEKTNSKAGSVVAINPKTGGVLGMVSLPSYDNNLFSKGISPGDYQKLINDPLKPLFNRSIAGTYPSGSAIKPLVAAAGLQDGTITGNTTLDTSIGAIKIGSWVFPDWKVHGLADVRKAIAESNDIFFYAVGGGWDKIKGLGAEKLHDYLVKFGLSKPLGIDLPGEANGLVPTPAWKQKVKKEAWYLGDTYHMAIGQGDVLVTPLQMANAIATIANGGELLKPYLVQDIKDSNGKLVSSTQKNILNKDFISSDNIRIVQEGMRQAVLSGSAQQFKDMSVEVAAKTGTAQFGDQDKTHAWMVAYAPYNDPQIAIAVIVEGAGEGYAAAGPVVKGSLNYFFSNR